MKPAEYLAQRFYTPAEAAPMLGIKTATLWKRIRLGKVKAGVGHRRLIAESEIARLLGLEQRDNP